MVLINKPTKIMSKVIDNSDSPTDTQVLTYKSASDQWKAEDGGGSGGSNFTASVKCVLEVQEGSNAYPDIHTLATASAKVSGFVMPNALDSTVNFKCFVPRDLAASPAAKFRVRIMTMDARTNEDIVLLLQHKALADTENLDQALVNTTSGGDSGALRMPNATESLDYYEATFQTQPVADDTIIGQITREASSDANDDYLADVLIIGIDLLINRTAI